MIESTNEKALSFRLAIKNKSVLCIGEMLWDCLPEGEKPGGAPMNVALHLKRFKEDVSLISRVGNDVKGEQLISFLKNSGFQTSSIQLDQRFKSGEVHIKLDEDKNAS